MAAKPIPLLFGKQESLPFNFIRNEEDSCIEGLTCPVCCELYSTQDNIKSPRILSSCGHTLCSGKIVARIVVCEFLYSVHCFLYVTFYKQISFMRSFWHTQPYYAYLP